MRGTGAQLPVVLPVRFGLSVLPSVGGIPILRLVDNPDTRAMQFSSTTPRGVGATLVVARHLGRHKACPYHKRPLPSHWDKADRRDQDNRPLPFHWDKAGRRDQDHSIGKLHSPALPLPWLANRVMAGLARHAGLAPIVVGVPGDFFPPRTVLSWRFARRVGLETGPYDLGPSAARGSACAEDTCAQLW